MHCGYPDNSSLVSIVIPCYNYGHYLAGAIESVLKQTYPIIEIIVIDDGSIDNTKEVAQGYQQVRYIYQSNKGLSASRNVGAFSCKGSYIVFLDADDWLYPEAIERNLNFLKGNPQAAFVSGAYDNVFQDDNKLVECKIEVPDHHYARFLGFNYVGMIATVLFRRSIFHEFSFNESLLSCEDHELYLNISRKYPVIHHTEKIAAYRRHASNMSTNFSVMLSAALAVLKQQKYELRTDEEKQAYKRSYNSLYKQSFQVTGGVEETNSIFKADRYQYYKHKIIFSMKKILGSL
jgi:glycosyltransferase involved in cell wall biosynthesis